METYVLNVVAIPILAPSDVAPPLFSAKRGCTASRFNPLFLFALSTCVVLSRLSLLFLLSLSSLSISHLFFSVFLSLSLLLRGGSGLVLPSRRVSFLHRGGPLSSIEAGFISPSMRAAVFPFSLRCPCVAASHQPPKRCIVADRICGGACFGTLLSERFRARMFANQVKLLVESYASTRLAALPATFGKTLAVQSGKGERPTGPAAACGR